MPGGLLFENSGLVELPPRINLSRRLLSDARTSRHHCVPEKYKKQTTHNNSWTSNESSFARNLAELLQHVASRILYVRGKNAPIDRVGLASGKKHPGSNGDDATCVPTPLWTAIERPSMTLLSLNLVSIDLTWLGNHLTLRESASFPGNYTVFTADAPILPVNNGFPNSGTLSRILRAINQLTKHRFNVANLPAPANCPPPPKLGCD